MNQEQRKRYIRERKKFSDDVRKIIGREIKNKLSISIKDVSDPYSYSDYTRLSVRIIFDGKVITEDEIVV